MAAIVRDQQPDVVHLHWMGGGSFRFSSLAGSDARSSGVCPTCGASARSNSIRLTRGLIETADGSPAAGGMPALAWRNKARTYANLGRVVIACPSRWLAREAGSSALLGGRDIEVVRTGCDTDLFQPRDPLEARRNAGLPADRAILAGADSLALPRKGTDLMCDAVARFRVSGAGDRAPMLVTFGGAPIDAARAGGGEYLHLGRIRERDRLALAYSAADLFIAPSRMENLANMR